MRTDDPPLITLLARFFSPFALPRSPVVASEGFNARRRRNKERLLQLLPLLRGYIFRSGMLVAALFALSILLMLLPFPHLALIGIAAWLLSLLHTALLIFMEQSANNLKSRLNRH